MLWVSHGHTKMNNDRTREAEMSKKYTSYEKLSKKCKKEIDAKKRRTWGNLSPLTRRAADPKAYDRTKFKKKNKKDEEE